MGRMKFIWILSAVLLLTGCANLREEPLPVDDVVVEEGVRKNGDHIFRYRERTVFEDIEAMITTEVYPEDFWAIYSEADSLGETVPCVHRTAVEDDRIRDIGWFYVDDGLKFEKICTDEDCREDDETACDHLVLAPAAGSFQEILRYGDSVYFIAPYIVPGNRNIFNYMILRWQDGADHFEKLFEIQRSVQNIHISNGLMYVNAEPNLGTEDAVYYILNLDYLVYTTVTIAYTDAEYLFGENHIVMYDRNGTYAVNSVLKKGNLILKENFPGQVAGDYYWYKDYVSNGYYTLYRMDLRHPGEKVMVMEDIRDFAVCGETLFWQPAVEPGHQVIFSYRNYEVVKGEKIYDEGLTGYGGHDGLKIMRARIFTDMTLGTPETVAEAGQNEWIGSSVGWVIIGDKLLYETVTPGNQDDVKWYEHTYIADWQKTRKFADRVQK